MNATGRVVRAVVLPFLLALATAGPAAADHGGATGKSYTFLQPGFTQANLGVDPQMVPLWGAPAFARDGDILVAGGDAFDAGPLYRFDMQSTPPPVHGTAVHTLSSTPSQTAIGLTNHPNGHMYTAGYNGLIQIDETSSTLVSGRPEDAGRGNGITVDPQTGNVVYVGQSGHTVRSFDLALGSGQTIVDYAPGGQDRFYELTFDPSGRFLFVADTEDIPSLDIFRRDGSLVRAVPMAGGPAFGVAFVTGTPSFVATSNLDGTMSRFDFPGGDLSAPPVQTTLASGGFHSTGMNRGPDGCLYVTMHGNRYDDGTVIGAQTTFGRNGSPVPLSQEESVVQIGPPGVTCNHVNLPPAGPSCKVTGGGQITAANGDRASFSGSAQPGDPPKGSIEYQDRGPAASLSVQSLRIDSIVCSANRTGASIFGKARVNGQGSTDFRIDVQDLGEPGNRDTYRIRVGQGYDSGEQKLRGGNVQIHK